ncbi:dipeptidyl peptidase 2-like [Acropora millepora]|uniref:dipeptidyl peptidase 2-like n=1 Tax=Acropora millepora TaxID=45264 RepID=UPI001CF42668|nr:dipeptidyl peptidase 2-like [Acropora millepora]
MACLDFFLVVSAFSLFTEAAVSYKTAYFEQRVDHFNFVQALTYKQRYIYTEQYWDKKGPIFFYTGNEGGITDFWNNSGFVFEAAEKFNALVIFGEHRYYGESLPFGPDESFQDDKIGYLTIEQALADYAVLLTELKTLFQATGSKVVAFGGSYGGMLSAYMRFKYPNVIDAALAASAPIYMVTFQGSEREFFFSAVTKDFQNADPNCPGYVVKAFQTIKMLEAQGAQGLAKISTSFNLCKPLKSVTQIPHLLAWIRNSFTTLAMGDYPYPTSFLAPLPGYPVNVVCKMMAEASYKLDGLASATALVYNGTNGTLPCLDPDTEYIECADPTGCGLGPDSMAWDYQACTEIALPGGSNGKTDMFPVLPFTQEMRAEYCLKKWKVTQRPNWTPIQYWGKDISAASNIIFSNGDLDPWRPGGVLESVSSTLVAVLVKGGAHHLDLRASNPQDPPTVTEARKLELQLIARFLE